MDGHSDHPLDHRAVVEHGAAHSFGLIASAQRSLFASGVHRV
jgi:hypothetical protein